MAHHRTINTALQDKGLSELLRMLAEIVHDPLDTYIIIATISGLSDGDISELTGLHRVTVGDRKQRMMTTTDAGHLLTLAYALHPAVNEDSIIKQRNLPTYQRRGQIHMGRKQGRPTR